MAAGTASPNYHGQLTAATVDTITMGYDWEQIQVINVDGSAAIYYTTDGSTPTVGGARCRVLPASICVDIVGIFATPTSTGTVQLISTGTPHYSIIGGL